MLNKTVLSVRLFHQFLAPTNRRRIRKGFHSNLFRRIYISGNSFLPKSRACQRVLLSTKRALIGFKGRKRSRWDAGSLLSRLKWRLLQLPPIFFCYKVYLEKYLLSLLYSNEPFPFLKVLMVNLDEGLASPSQLEFVSVGPLVAEPVFANSLLNQFKF